MGRAVRRAVPYVAARAALLRDLEAAFAAGTFERAYPGAKAPMSVSIGGDSQEPPFEVIVWPLPASVTNTHRSANGCSVVTTEFDLTVGVVATGATEADASAMALAYIDCIYQVCMADPTLGGTVDHARPAPNQAGVGTDSTWGFTCGANLRVSCRRDIPVNKIIARAVREAA